MRVALRAMASMVLAAARPLIRLGLVARFTIIGVGVGVLVAGGLAWYIENRMTELVLDQAVARAIDQVQLGVLDHVAPADFVPPYTPEKLDEFGRHLDPLFARVQGGPHGVIRLNLFARDGTVLYSDRPSQRGQVHSPERSPLLASARARTPGRTLSSLSSSENADLKARYGSALEVYVPLVLDGRVVGAYEIYGEQERGRVA